MNYGELRQHFQDLLNRSDCTDEQADIFIGMGLRRVERLLRTPMQKTEATAIVDDTWDGYLTIPADYLGIYILYLDGKPLSRIAPTQQDDFSGWFIENALIKVNAPVQVGQVFKIEYFNEFEFPISDDSGTSIYALTIPDLVVYSAMVYACTFFIDARKQDFVADLGAMLAEVQEMADMDAMAGTGMQITPQGGGIV
jgi:hypothetical protein